MAVGAFSVGCGVVVGCEKVQRAGTEKLQRTFTGTIKPPPMPAACDLYVWGENKYKTVPGTNQARVAYPEAVPYFNGKGVAAVVFAETYAAAADKKGNVHVWGAALQTKENAAAPSEPKPILTGAGIVQLAAAKSAVLALSSSGHVYVVDVNPSAVAQPQSVGYFSGGTTLPLPSLDWGDKIVKISGGEHHLVALTSKGRLFTCGLSPQSNIYGQLGLGHMDDVTNQGTARQFHEVRTTYPAKDIASGANHSLVVLENGDVMSFGRNNLLQLGIGEFKDTLSEGEPSPMKVRFLFPQGRQPGLAAVGKQVAAGGDVSVIVTSSDAETEIWTCGYGVHGTLGNGMTVHAQGFPALVKTISNKRYFNEATKRTEPMRVLSLAAGQGHVAVALSSRDLYFWGHNLMHQLGNGKIVNMTKPGLARSNGEPQGYLLVPHLASDLNVALGYNNSAVFKR
eukprot:comp23770_c0_seq3/m.41193 comp23770_c0_seq3/g.41193  ORF comp23770_c0_seq3/g.41193 comp23770_c0_seq3/m.41193 type:complete len:453 (-) comp23770_c0_seq3:630-1988(-)